MLWTIIVILVVLWLLGLTRHVGRSLIHLPLVIAVIVDEDFNSPCFLNHGCSRGTLPISEVRLWQPQKALRPISFV